MDDLTKGAIIGGLFSLMTVVLPALINKFKGTVERKRLEIEADTMELQTMVGLRAQVLDLMNQVRKLQTEYEDVIKKMKKDYVVLWGYMIELVESHRRHDILPPPPPDEMKTDPDLARLFKHKKDS